MYTVHAARPSSPCIHIDHTTVPPPPPYAMFRERHAHAELADEDLQRSAREEHGQQGDGGVDGVCVVGWCCRWGGNGRAGGRRESRQAGRSFIPPFLPFPEPTPSQQTKPTSWEHAGSDLVPM